MNDTTASAIYERVPVLIVDDSEDAATSLVMLFELEDIAALTAPDAETALRMVERVLPTLLLIDIGLPGIDGYELARRLRRLPQLRGSTLIALTGRDGQAGGELAADFDQFWIKPFDPKRLIEEVRSVISRAEQARASA